MSATLKIRHHDYLEKTIQLREQLEGGFILLAERLKKIRDERIYDPDYESFPDFLRELRISNATASKLIGVYEKFVILGGIAVEDLAKQGWTNLSIFLPRINTKKDAVAIYEKVAPLDRTDALRAYEEMKRGVEMSKCQHEWQEVHIRQCLACGLKEQVFSESPKFFVPLKINERK